MFVQSLLKNCRNQCLFEANAQNVRVALNHRMFAHLNMFFVAVEFVQFSCPGVIATRLYLISMQWVEEFPKLVIFFTAIVGVPSN